MLGLNASWPRRIGHDTFEQFVPYLFDGCGGIVPAGGIVMGDSTRRRESSAASRCYSTSRGTYSRDPSGCDSSGAENA